MLIEIIKRILFSSPVASNKERDLLKSINNEKFEIDKGAVFFQIDGSLNDSQFRFWMNSCGGRDQVAMQAHKGGWISYEAPLPRIIGKWCHRFEACFLDIGSNTGFYSILAAALGASKVLSFEPHPKIYEILIANISISEFDAIIFPYKMAISDNEGLNSLYIPMPTHGLVETSSSLSADFRGQHSEVIEVQVSKLDSVVGKLNLAHGKHIVKIDVEGLEPKVLAGAEFYIRNYRPAIIIEILPDQDINKIVEFCGVNKYEHFLPLSEERFLQCDLSTNNISHESRDHILLPQSTKEDWMEVL